MINFIVAMAEDRGIGLDGDIPWRIPADWQYVKRTTIGHTLLMGRKTFESIGSKPLPGRKSVILTRSNEYRPEGAVVVHSIEEALELLKGEEVFVFGGAELYKLMLPYADKLYITEIAHTFPADTFFPEFSKAEWEETSRTPGTTDEKNPYKYDFVVYERVRRTS
jgi:dihydrofolate reductase